MLRVCLGNTDAEKIGYLKSQYDAAEKTYARRKKRYISAIAAYQETLVDVSSDPV